MGITPIRRTAPILNATFFSPSPGALEVINLSSPFDEAQGDFFKGTYTKDETLTLVPIWINRNIDPHHLQQPKAWDIFDSNCQALSRANFRQHSSTEQFAIEKPFSKSSKSCETFLRYVQQVREVVEKRHQRPQRLHPCPEEFNQTEWVSFKCKEAWELLRAGAQSYSERGKNIVGESLTSESTNVEPEVDLNRPIGVKAAKRKANKKRKKTCNRRRNGARGDSLGRPTYAIKGKIRIRALHERQKANEPGAIGNTQDACGRIQTKTQMVNCNSYQFKLLFFRFILDWNF